MDRTVYQFAFRPWQWIQRGVSCSTARDLI